MKRNTLHPLSDYFMRHINLLCVILLRTTHLAFRLLRFYGELLRPMFRASSQVVDPRLQSFRPPIEMHRRQRAIIRVLHPQIQALTLTYIRPAVRRHINNMFHRNLPDRLIFIFDVLRQPLYVLDAPLVRNNTVFQIGIPQSQFDQVFHQKLVG